LEEKDEKSIASNEATGKKKRPHIKQVLEWILLGVLIFFLISAFVYEAPLKIKLLLIIFTLSCTALQPQYRKWFWLGVVIVFTGVVVWILLPEGDNWESYQYEFAKDIEEINSIYHIADEDNAALVYKSFFKDYALNDLTPYNNHRETYFLTQQYAWASDEHPELFFWLKDKEEIISRYIEAAQKGKCFFPIESRDITASLITSKREYLRFMKSISCIVLCSACNDLGEGHVEEALAKQLAALRTSEYLRAQPMDLDLLTGISIQGMTLNSIQLYTIKNEVRESYLESIEEVLGGISHNWPETWERVKRVKQLQNSNYLYQFLYEENPQGKVRIKVQNYFFLGNFIGTEDLDYWYQRAAKAQNIIVWFFLPSHPDKIKDIVGESIDDYLLMEKFIRDRDSMTRAPSFVQEKLNLGSFINLNMNRTVFNLYETYQHIQTELQASRLMISLRRYKNKNGDWPERAEDIKEFGKGELLVDPVNGQEYVYQYNNGDFVLYSKGLNKTDDDGFHYQRDHGKEGCDDWWIWPPR
jgi:hypothetical protein